MMALVLGGIDCLAIGLEHVRAYCEQARPNIAFWMYIVPVVLVFSLLGYFASDELDVA